VIPFLAIAACGLALGLDRKLPIMPAVVVLAAFIAPHLPLLGTARYHVPIVPFLSIFAAIAVATFLSRWLPGIDGRLVASEHVPPNEAWPRRQGSPSTS
jgi:hypothetical protein